MRSFPRRRTAWLVVLAFAASLNSPLLSARHGLFEPVDACKVDLAFSSPADPHLELAPPPIASHCAVCHWLRALRGITPLGSGPLLQLPQPRAADLPVITAALHDALARHRPSRAPPSTQA